MPTRADVMSSSICVVIGLDLYICCSHRHAFSVLSDMMKLVFVYYIKTVLSTRIL